ncbi:MAG TPA: HAD domain-containing protein [Bradyrhizobium sp.]|nr:HAD domain-containing protein [Bradyrhizobium sp.]
MKVIFLDIDGVLNCRKTPNPRKLPYIVDQKLLARFQELVRRTGASVVLTSTWRYDPAGLFAAKHHGVPFIDVTPDLPKQPRSKEILEWVRGHPDVTRYAVLDDEDDQLDALPLFQPSPRTGLTEKIAAALADYLDGKTDQDMRCARIVRLMQNIRSIFTRHPG